MSFFDSSTRVLVHNLYPRGIQKMLDYDFMIGREPSVEGIVQPGTSQKFHTAFFGEKEILIRVYDSIQAGVEATNSTVLLNFASHRSAFDITQSYLDLKNFGMVYIIAEGVPEMNTLDLRTRIQSYGGVLLGPSSIGGIRPGHFKIGEIGGSEENIVSSRLDCVGNVGLVTRSGGLFNELAKVIAENAQGIYEGMAIGGDRFPGVSFVECIKEWNNDDNVDSIVMIGEVGGDLEYEVVEYLKNGKLNKPLIAWCIGTTSDHMPVKIQFGHAGARAFNNREEAATKNAALREAGALVPETFEFLGELIKSVQKGEFNPQRDREVTTNPPTLQQVKNTTGVRLPTHFISTISNDTGEEATYNGKPISYYVNPENNMTIVDVLTSLWFKRTYPTWARDFIEMVIKVLADHGPAVSGAHNARVTARAGKDVVDSLVSGLLTIGPRFGGAIDEAAHLFLEATISGEQAKDFVSRMKASNKRISGIGHKVKSIHNPDKRVEILIEYAQTHFPQISTLYFAQEVEKETTSKKDNLILNVDGAVAALMIDLWYNLDYSDVEIQDMIDSGVLNGFFVISRSIGFIGHILDEKRQGSGLYRHPTDDILYID